MYEEVPNDCFNSLPEDWQAEIGRLQPGEKWERMGKAWFYLPPHDDEDCFWEAEVQDGVIVVTAEVGPESLVRWFAVPQDRHQPEEVER
jgi:hypothetical protein